MFTVVTSRDHQVKILDNDWLYLIDPLARSIEAISRLENHEWMQLAALKTRAAADAEKGHFSWNSPPPEEEHLWYKKRITLPQSRHLLLHLEGLATHAVLYINGLFVAENKSMFTPIYLELDGFIKESHQVEHCNFVDLYIEFKSLLPLLKVKRPRPKWRTNLVQAQNLRFIRTTLLGRIRSLSPPVIAQGPYRPVNLISYDQLRLEDPHLTYCLSQDLTSALVFFHARINHVDLNSISHVELAVGPFKCTMELKGPEAPGDLCVLKGHLPCPNIELWWPHTHGVPTLYPAKIQLYWQTPAVSPAIFELGQLGFRKLDWSGAGEKTELRVNNQPVFCRGVCWTPVDPLALKEEVSELKKHLELIQNAGMNMVRILGHMVYESTDFYRICAEMGLMVWQDFMFASMDYPFSDPDFAKSVDHEIKSFLSRTQLCCSLVLACGNSEVSQQAAMFGAPRNAWNPPFFTTELPQLVKDFRPDLPYVTSSPSGGDLPFTLNSGISHYYGVGAYLLPVEDARHSGVLFASECLGLSNIPEPSSMESLGAEGQVPFHHPHWKARVPRDFGASIDFEDVREHYLLEIFQMTGEELAQLKRAHPQKALRLGRLASGVLFSKVLSEWRRPESTCKGALIWLFKDLWEGAGWGIVDHMGKAKSPYFFARRSLASQSVSLMPERLNGLFVYVYNERSTVLNGKLKLTVYRDPKNILFAQETLLQVPARKHLKLPMTQFIDYFFDATYTYQFGPKSHLGVHVRFQDDSGLYLDDWYFPNIKDLSFPLDLNVLEYRLTPDKNELKGSWQLELKSPQVTPWICLDFSGYQVSDNYFCLSSEDIRKITLTPLNVPNAIKSAHSLGHKPEGYLWTHCSDSPLKILPTPVQAASLIGNKT